MHVGNIPDSSVFPESDDKTVAHISSARNGMDFDSRRMHGSLFRFLCDSVCVEEASYCEQAFLTLFFVHVIGTPRTASPRSNSMSLVSWRVFL